MIRWKKDKHYKKHQCAYVGDYHIATFIEHGYGGGKLLLQFYGWTEETDDKVDCPGGFVQAKRELPEILHDFLAAAMGVGPPTFEEFWEFEKEYFLRCKPRTIAVNCSIDGMGRAFKAFREKGVWDQVINNETEEEPAEIPQRPGKSGQIQC